MHCHSELLSDLTYSGAMPDELMLKWFNDRYSTSKHLLTLYSIARGLNAKVIAEVGFGRSSFVLVKAAIENQGVFYSCDNRDFSYLLNEEEKSASKFILGDAKDLWGNLESSGADMIFLDYLSSEQWSKEFVFNAFYDGFNILKRNGIICVHDVADSRFQVTKVFDSILTKKFGLIPNRDLEMVRFPFNYGLGIVRRLKPSRFGELEDDFIKKPDES